MARASLEAIHAAKRASEAADDLLDQHIRVYGGNSATLPPDLAAERRTLLIRSEAAHGSYAELIYGTE